MLELTKRSPPRLPMLCFFSYSLKSFILYESKTIKPSDRRGIAGKNKKLITYLKKQGIKIVKEAENKE